MSNYDKRKISEWTENEKSGLRMLAYMAGMMFYAVFGVIGIIFLILKG